MTHEVIQNALGAERRAAVNAGDVKRAEGLKDLMKRAGRGNARGWFTENGQILVEQDPLASVVAEFRAGRLNTPEAVTSSWQLEWRVRGEQVGLNIAVPAFEGSQADLNEHILRGDRPIFVPTELSTQATRHLLGKIWPAMQSHSVAENTSVTNEVDHSGWRYTEATTNAPYLDTTEKQLKDQLKKANREGLTATEYIIASQDHKLLTGEYFDQGSTWSRLLESRLGGEVVDADFYSDGYLGVHWYLKSDDHHPSLGGRSSVGVKKA
ncbi:hypothetical protein A3C59_03370 [Candidatus Daviesbacteria bacterium RIFCSPHIGHO2_02_FULL_36_13]|uniref:Uncharacterized protein n=1 Tax=Candidatus Daviesbacteria bacterium RIFCSPHIGHO2_02_FULL_36_13 TaxID=1797768 RepID=A0A1F5JQ65_9BACT|nr:MAG: hypothetical protein A3C59_03370 [Candidatus Daviesbacteria bacterium RIFCSPHIGHO2_02_FULL_36_13]OGE41613.1 MAG: hypothetical protein A3A45_01680 [Candidatus Daviesbacteria bacterium RIFCSPLOWO2_01_FULL_36_8]